MSKKEPLSFEANLDALNKIVERLEQEPLSLEESLQQFKEGVALTQSCQQALKNAEQTIQKINTSTKLNNGDT